jgi:hypothetical protein
LRHEIPRTSGEENEKEKGAGAHGRYAS